MDMRQKILDYPKQIVSIQEKCNDDLVALDSLATENAYSYNAKITSAYNEISDYKRKANEYKSILEKGIKYLLKKNAEKSLKPNLSFFEIEPSYLLDRETTEEEIAKTKKDLVDAYKQIKKRKEQVIPTLEKEKSDIANEMARKKEDTRAKAVDDINVLVDGLKKEYASIDTRLPYGSSHVFSFASKLPDSLYLGNYLLPLLDPFHPISSDTTLKARLELSAKECPNLLFRIDSRKLFSDNHFIEKAIVGLLLRHIESFPSGKLHFGIYSPSIDSFPLLRAAFIGSKGKITTESSTFTTSDEFVKMMSKISREGERREEILLSASASSIYELYERGDDSLPFHLYIIHGVFADMRGKGIDMLLSSLKGLGRCGFRFLLIDDFASEAIAGKPSDFAAKLIEIAENCFVFDLYAGNISTMKGEALELVSASSFTAQQLYDGLHNLLISVPDKEYEHDDIGVHEEKEVDLAKAFKTLRDDARRSLNVQEGEKKPAEKKEIWKVYESSLASYKSKALKTEEIEVPEVLEEVEIKKEVAPVTETKENAKPKEEDNRKLIPDYAYFTSLPEKVQEDAFFINKSLFLILQASGLNTDSVQNVTDSFKELVNELAPEGVAVTEELLLATKYCFTTKLKEEGYVMSKETMLAFYLRK